MRVDAHREPRRRPDGAHIARTPRFLLVASGEDAHRRFESRLPGPSDNSLEIRLEDIVGEVAVGIDHENDER
jgi:hypothetical protein